MLAVGHLTDRLVHTISKNLNDLTKSVKVSYPNGDRYQGETAGSRETLRHGGGVYHYGGGHGHYEGEWVDDEKHGCGTFFFEDGDVFDGQWCNDRQHGRGHTAHWSPEAGVWVYSGEFREGRRHGSGELIARERGGLFGAWESGTLQRGVELRQQPRLSVSTVDTTAVELADGDHVVGSHQVPAAVRVELGPPQNWSPHEVGVFLQSLGFESDPEDAVLSLDGQQLIALPDIEQLVSERKLQLDSGLSDMAQAWRRTLHAVHSAIREAVESGSRLRNWADFQGAVPAVQTRMIPFAEIAMKSEQSSGAAKSLSGDWQGMPVDLFMLPLSLPFSSRAKAPVPDSGEELCQEGSQGFQPTLVATQCWARDLEVLASIRSPHLRTLLGVTICPDDIAASQAILTLVFEASRGSRLLFELIHAASTEGRRQPLDTAMQLRICIGICTAMEMLASRGLVFAALCSVNVEIVPSGTDGAVARLTRTGASWWRWGWTQALQQRDGGVRSKPRALKIDDVVRKYALCPVNWLAPEVLRGESPTEAADVCSFGLLLWELLHRSIPYAEYSIAQIVGAVGFGRRQLRASASATASTEASLLHEITNWCLQWEPHRRPAFGKLLDSLRTVRQSHERRRAKGSLLGKMGRAATGSALLASGLFAAADAPPPQRDLAAQESLEISMEDGPRMVRLDCGDWVRVDVDLLEQFPDDEEKWRTLMEFRSRLACDALTG